MLYTHPMSAEPKPFPIKRQHPETGVAAVQYAKGAWARVWPMGVRDVFMAEDLSQEELTARMAACVDVGKGPTPTDAQWARLFATWAAISRAPEPVDVGKDSAKGGAVHDALGLSLALAVRLGHSRADILEHTQEGAPYRGWTAWQLRYWIKQGLRLLDREEARLMGAVNLAMYPFHAKSATAAKQALEQRMRRLTSG